MVKALATVTIRLRTGRIIELRRLTQWPTDDYGPADGAPLAEVNKQIVDDSIERLASESRAVLLIPPEQRRLRILDRPAELGVAAVLPNIWVEADFSSGPIGEGYDSTLTIIWFQDQWALPIDPSIRSKIEVVDWNVHAYEGSNPWADL
jgi:hypothetical protein